METGPNRSSWQIVPHRTEYVGGAQPAPTTINLHSLTGRADTDGLLNISRLLLVRKRLIVLFTAIGALVGIVLSLREPVLYRARAALEVQLFNENFMGVGNIDPQAGSYAPTEANMRTHIQVLRSKSLGRDVVARVEREAIPSLAPTPSGKIYMLRRWAAEKFFNAEENDPVAAMRAAARMAASTLDVRGAVGTRVLEISCQSTHPEIAARFVNTLVDEFINQNLASRMKGIQRTSDWMRGQLDGLRSRLIQSEEKLQAFIRANGGSVPAVDGDSIAQLRVQQGEQSLAILRAERVTRQSSLEMATSAPLESFILTPEGSTLRSQYAQLTEFQRQRAELSEKLTPEHARMKKLQFDIGSLEAAIDRERSAIALRLRRDVEDIQSRERIHATGLSRDRGSQSLRGDKVMEYTMLKRQADTDRQLYQAMLQNVNYAGLAAAIPANNLRVVDPAEAGLEPANIRSWFLSISLGGFSGFLLAVAIAVIKARGSRLFMQPGEVSNLLDVPELAVIPSGQLRARRRWWQPNRRALTGLLAAAENDDTAVEMVTWNEKPSIVAESFRSMRASLFGPVRNSYEPHVIVITSPGPRAGKSTVATNLAISLAEVKRKVLLVDADFRAPRLHRILGLTNDAGFSELIQAERGSDRALLRTLVQKTEVPHLDLLSSGPLQTNPGALFYSHTLNDVLRLLREEYEHVIIDTAPVMLFADARVVGRLSDAVLLVVRAGLTDEASALAARQRLLGDGIPLTGVVLNDWVAEQSHEMQYNNYYDGYASQHENARS
jgi:polysaccharide biosynthesis transport protein